MGVAVPRTSVEPPRTEVREPSGGSLSLQTLIIAALASGTAAVVVSHFWARGTVLASAMTPVAVAVISEMLKKPVESERVRGSVRAVSSFSRPSSGRTPRVMAPPAPGVDEGLEQRDNGVEAGPVRVYSSGSNKRPASPGATSERRKLHLKIAVVTGLVGFLIAAAALTLPELIFGGSVTGGHRNTTYFGGGSKSTQDKSKDGTGGTNDSTNQQQTDQQQTTDSTTPGDSGAKTQGTTPTAPDQTAPQQTQPPQSQNPAPQTPAPAPSAPAP
jgi:hypothetical protein